MGFKIQSRGALLDFWEGRLFRSPSIAMVQDASKLGSYNPKYLSVTFRLGTEPEGVMTKITYDGRVRHFRLPHDRYALSGGLFYEHLMLHEKRPFFVINGDTDLMARIAFDKEDMEYLQGKDVAFYLYEPLFCGAGEGGRRPAFFDLQKDVFFPELMWIEDFIYNNGGNFKAKVQVCDYRLQDYLNYKGLHPQLEVKTWDIFLCSALYGWLGVEEERDPDVRTRPYPFVPELINQKYICLNYRYEGVRELIVGFLMSSIFDKKGHISFFHYHNFKSLLFETGFDPRKLSRWPAILEGIKSMQELLPLTLDTKNSRAIKIAGFSLPDHDAKSNIRDVSRIHRWYDDSFLAIVNESRYATYCGELSEKILQPLIYMRPFVMVGGPHMLRYLRELGFETFGDFWDESYDLIEDHVERLEAIFDLLEQILSKPLQELQQMLKEMEPILRRNRSHVFRGLHKKMFADIAADQEKKV